MTHTLLLNVSVETYEEAGHIVGAEIEANFTRAAKEAGLSDEQAKSAYNQNMLGGGLLADGAREFAKQHGRRWLLTAYEAGDVVLHNSYAVSPSGWHGFIAVC